MSEIKTECVRLARALVEALDACIHHAAYYDEATADPVMTEFRQAIYPDAGVGNVEDQANALEAFVKAHDA